MNEIIERTLLFDFYGELLTEKQKSIYEYHYLDDLSLSEIAEIMDISRQGVHDALKRCDLLLKKYETKLLLVEKFVKNKERINDIYQLSSKLQDEINGKEIEYREEIEQINEIAKTILDDL